MVGLAALAGALADLLPEEPTWAVIVRGLAFCGGFFGGGVIGINLYRRWHASEHERKRAEIIGQAIKEAGNQKPPTAATSHAPKESTESENTADSRGHEREEVKQLTQFPGLEALGHEQAEAVNKLLQIALDREREDSHRRSIRAQWLFVAVGVPISFVVDVLSSKIF
jgi:hypothetical protein